MAHESGPGSPGIEIVARSSEEAPFAGRILIGAAEGRDFLMQARIGVLKALNRNIAPVFEPSSKKTHWVKLKLKRDE
jgi:hypothetical protein